MLYVIEILSLMMISCEHDHIDIINIAITVTVIVILVVRKYSQDYHECHPCLLVFLAS